MRGPRRSAAVAVASVLALASAPGAAQTREPRPPSPAPDEARAAFERGVAAIADGRYADAIEPLTHSLALRPVPIVRYNLGLAYRGAGRHVAAIREFSRYLREHEPDAELDRLSAVRAEVTRLRAMVGTVDIAAAPSDVAVRIDGQLRELEDDGTVLVEPGSHHVEVRARGYRPSQDDVFVAAGERVTFRMTLATETPPPPPGGGSRDVRPPPPPRGVSISPLLPIGGAVAIASGAAMVVIQLTGNPIDARYEASGCRMMPPGTLTQDCQRDHDDLAGRITAETVLGVVTGVAAAVGVVGIVLTVVNNRPRPAPHTGQPTVLLGPNALGVRVAF